MRPNPAHLRTISPKTRHYRIMQGFRRMSWRKARRLITKSEQAKAA